MNVFSRAHRILKRMERYIDLSTENALPNGAPQLPELRADEKPVGLYLNDTTEFSDCVFFSTSGIYIYTSQTWEHVPFDFIASPQTPATKQDVRGFSLLLRDGSQRWLPVTGSQLGRFYDAFGVLQFVMRVCGDLRRNGHQRDEALNDQR